MTKSQRNLMRNLLILILALSWLSGCGILSSSRNYPQRSDLHSSPLNPFPAVLSPDHLILVSGDSQTAAVNTTVGFPPKVQVVDSSGRGVPNIPLSFTIASGNGFTGSTII